MLVALTATNASAQEAPPASAAADADVDQAIIVIGSRRAEARTAADSAVPVDVLRADDLTSQASSDIIDVMTSVVPSLNSNREPISDAATLVRPVNLRALPADSARAGQRSPSAPRRGGR